MANKKLFFMSGAGNLFVVVDGRNFPIDFDFSTIAQKICSKSINNMFDAEGLLVLTQSNNDNDFDCLFYNPDGSSGMMCGNGARCIVVFANKQGMVKNRDKITFTMAGTIYSARFVDEMPEISFPPINTISFNQKIIYNANQVEYTYIFNGSDHFVIELDQLGESNLKSLDLIKFANFIQSQKAIFPQSTNVNVYDIDIVDVVNLRTFERGVFKETGACGTGAIATAFATYKSNGLKFPIYIKPTSGYKLKVDVIIENQTIKNVLLSGHAEITSWQDFNFEKV